ncbi:MAG: alpha/beta hydrolase-fold protein [Cyclobacteriaceae bacterium]
MSRIFTVVILLASFSAKSQIEQHKIGEVTLEVYLPPNYYSGNTYPAVYSNDGEWLFGKNSWRLDEKLDEWIKDNLIDPVIFVAIAHPGRRESNYIPYDDPTIANYVPKADEYTSQFIDEIIPFVESKYSTSGQRAIMGASFGGLHSTWAGLKNPDIFSFVIAQSPSYWVNDFEIHKEEIARGNQSIWIDIGTKDWDDVLTMYYTLSKGGFVPGKDLFYYEDENGSHSGTSWSNRLKYPLILFTKGADSKIISFDLKTEYIPSAQRQGHYFSRINPVVTLKNGLKFTSIPLIFSTKEGNAEVSPYGSFKIQKGTSDEVSGEYSGEKASMKVKWKDNPMND